MSLHHLQVREAPANRLPHRFDGRGVGSLSSAELLSLFFGCSGTGRASIDIAQDALATLGGIDAVFAADEPTLCAISGLGPSAHSRLRAALELVRRVTFEDLCRRDVLASPEDVRRYLALHLAGLTQEVFGALFLDNRHRVIAYRELFVGTIDSAAVYPREVVRCCLALNAAAVIFAHNHPSGMAEPSDTDVRLTRKLVDALALIDIRVLDHLVVGKGVTTSLAERGLM